MPEGARCPVDSLRRLIAELEALLEEQPLAQDGYREELQHVVKSCNITEVARKTVQSLNSEVSQQASDGRGSGLRVLVARDSLRDIVVESCWPVQYRTALGWSAKGTGAVASCGQENCDSHKASDTKLASSDQKHQAENTQLLSFESCLPISRVHAALHTASLQHASGIFADGTFQYLRRYRFGRGNEDS